MSIQTVFKISFNEMENILEVEEKAVLKTSKEEDSTWLYVKEDADEDELVRLKSYELLEYYKNVFDNGYGLMGHETIYVSEFKDVEPTLNSFWQAIKVYQESIISDFKELFDSHSQKIECFKERALLEFSDCQDNHTHIYGEVYLSRSDEDYMAFYEGYKSDKNNFKTTLKRRYPINHQEFGYSEREITWDSFHVSLDGMFNLVQFILPKETSKIQLNHYFKQIFELTQKEIVSKIEKLNKEYIPFDKEFSYSVVSQSFIGQV